MSFASDLEILIRARYPILYIHTSEEARVLPVVQAVATRRNKKVYEWSFSTGLIPGGSNIQSQKGRSTATKDPIAALDQVIEQVEPAIFVFKDFHPFLAKCNKSTNMAPIRKLRDVAVHLKNSFKTIILISPLLEIPAELEKEVMYRKGMVSGRIGY